MLLLKLLPFLPVPIYTPTEDMSVPFRRKAKLFWQFVLLPPLTLLLVAIPAIAARALVLLFARRR
jgi:hypothetical protein